MKKRKTISITFELDTDLVLWLDKRAEEEDQSRAAVLRKIVKEDYIRKNNSWMDK